MISDQIQTGRLGVITGARLRTLRIHPLRSRRRPHCPCSHPPLPSPWPSRRPLPWMWALSRSCRPRDRMTMTKTSWASSVSYQQRHKPAPRDSELKEVALKKRVCVELRSAAKIFSQQVSWPWASISGWRELDMVASFWGWAGPAWNAAFRYSRHLKAILHPRKGDSLTYLETSRKFGHSRPESRAKLIIFRISVFSV